jgi:CRP/FNR family cyclic AMP-dependent transcriptional regulator
MATSKPAPRDLIDAAPLTDLLRALAHEGEVRRYAKGTLIIDEGSVGDTLYIILAGRLRAFSTNAINGREFTYGVYGPGEYVGEMGLDGGPRSASVVALEACVCSRVERPTLERFFAAHPKFAFEVMGKVIRRARAATMSLKQVALNDVYGRLKMVLESMAEDAGDGTRVIRERPTHLALAQRAGCGREMVSRVMADLAAGGYLAPTQGAAGIVLLRALPVRW